MTFLELTHDSKKQSIKGKRAREGRGGGMGVVGGMGRGGGGWSSPPHWFGPVTPLQIFYLIRGLFNFFKLQIEWAIFIF